MRTLLVLINVVSLTMGRLVGKEVMFKLEQSIMDSWLCLLIHDHENNDEDDEDDDDDDGTC